ncbi:MAG: histidine phosphatase family protein [Tessaracoccus sp.]|uniref:SixA phosphatase family protein n=1 Tax=Tessaracoccus sp. TaxID=1971211 RepID=UPI001EB53390|nr:histidine phosphatase family protein [Tessaracoccus sp.]MBK7822571.1 histidine phosphatase family protein [Tessaracoccus sp.]
MRRLVLMRHAKTEATNPLGDKARRLTSRGVQDSQAAGIELVALGVDHALVSTATRTRETFAATGVDVPAEFQDALYFHGTETMLARIGETSDDVHCLLVIGHAPTIPSLTAELAYASDRRAADEAQCWYPTAAYSTFEFEGSWADLADGDFGAVRLTAIRRPH